MARFSGGEAGRSGGQGGLLTWTALALLTLVVIWAAWPGVGRAAAAPTADDCASVYVVSNGFHSGLAVPGALAQAKGFPTRGAAWVEFGWGEAQAYQAPSLTLANALRSVFAPGPTTLLVLPLPDRPDRVAGLYAIELGLSQSGMDTLMGDLQAEAQWVGPGEPVVLSERNGGVFLAANSPFRLWRMCNAWTAERLRRAGLDLHDRLLFHSDLLMWAADRKPTCGELAAHSAAAPPVAPAETRQSPAGPA